MQPAQQIFIAFQQTCAFKNFPFNLSSTAFNKNNLVTELDKIIPLINNNNNNNNNEHPKTKQLDIVFAKIANTIATSWRVQNIQLTETFISSYMAIIGMHRAWQESRAQNITMDAESFAQIASMMENMVRNHVCYAYHAYSQRYKGFVGLFFDSVEQSASITASISWFHYYQGLPSKNQQEIKSKFTQFCTACMQLFANENMLGEHANWLLFCFHGMVLDVCVAHAFFCKHHVK